MSDLRASSCSSRSADEGISLIEVLVAMMVFAIIASGLIAGMVTITKMTADDRAKVVAANLAAQDLDLVRAISDPFDVSGSPATDVLVGGRTYTVTRTTSWVSQAGGDVSCGSATNLFLLRVNTRVTWVGKLGTRAVQDDTILAPSSRISDTSTGAVAVAVVGADGLPESGIAVTITPTNGGAALTTQPANTGKDGCAYATQVSPGTYSVTLSRAGWVDTNQQAKPVKSVTVGAGTTQSVGFQYDQAATFTTQYANNYKASAALIPATVDTNFINTNGTYTTSTPAASVQLHPYASGYSVVVGDTTVGTTTCASVDPQSWLKGSSPNGVALGNGVRATAAAGPGKTATFGTPGNLQTISMGVVLVKNVPAGYYLGAIQSSTMAAGNPGCGITGQVLTYAAATTGGTTAIALPYGAWRVYYGASVDSATAVSAANLSVPTNVGGNGVSTDGTVTLDPRPAQ